MQKRNAPPPRSVGVQSIDDMCCSLLVLRRTDIGGRPMLKSLVLGAALAVGVATGHARHRRDSLRRKFRGAGRGARAHRRLRPLDRISRRRHQPRAAPHHHRTCAHVSGVLGVDVGAAISRHGKGSGVQALRSQLLLRNSATPSGRRRARRCEGVECQVTSRSCCATFTFIHVGATAGFLFERWLICTGRRSVSM